MKSRKDFETANEYVEYLKIHFAGLAMQGLMSIYDNPEGIVPNKANVSYMAKLSVLASDELLKQLEI